MYYVFPLPLIKGEIERGFTNSRPLLSPPLSSHPLALWALPLWQGERGGGIGVS